MRIPAIPKKFIPLTIVLGALLLVILLAAVLPQRDDSKPPTKPEPTPVSTIVIKALAEEPDDLTIDGEVEPNLVVNISAEVAGRVDRIENAKGETIREGDMVARGEPVVFLNTDLLKAEYDQAAANKAFYENEESRVKIAQEKGVATPKEVDEVMNNKAAAIARFDLAAAQLKRATIVAPVAGRINRIPVDVGEYLQPGMEAFEIVDMDTVKVIVYVPEKDIQFFSPGLEAKIVATVKGEKVEMTGKITFIDALADKATRKTRIEITVNNREGLLRSRQTVDVTLRRRMRKNVILIPLGAVIPSGDEDASGRYIVYVVDGGKAYRKYVQFDGMKGKDVFVNGLSDGDHLIVSGQQYVADGQEVDEKPKASDKGSGEKNAQTQPEDAPGDAAGSNP